VLNEHTSRSNTAYAWLTEEKWVILTVVARCQISMNFNAAAYFNAVSDINSPFDISYARLRMTSFSLPYVIRCERWLHGLKKLANGQSWISLELTNVSTLVCARTEKSEGISGGRIMGGPSLA
jgi:hypothetical protein